MIQSFARALVILIGVLLPASGFAAVRPAEPTVITVRPKPTDLERLAASEVQRYVYLRTGRLVPIKRGSTAGDRIVVTCKDSAFCSALGRDLAAQQFTLRTTTAAGKKIWWIIGGDEAGTLYGAYRFAEKLGARFGIDEDVLPDALLAGSWPEPDETGKPRFALRGLQPFHDFSVGPDWWNREDYENVLAQMTKLRLNFIGLHTYPSWNPAAGPEANVWIGLPEDVDKHGNVRFGYEAGVVTTRRGWAVKPFPTSRYASGAGLLFAAEDYGPDFMQGCLDWPKTADSAAAMFNRYGDLQQAAFSYARRLGVKTCVGTELPLGVPKMLAERLAARGLKADDPATIRQLYEGTFLRITRKMPVDYYWFWAPEIWLVQDPGCKDWEIASTANVEHDLAQIEAAAATAGAPFGFATSGWRLGTRQDALWFDKRTPKSWTASAIGTSLGQDPVEKAFGQMPGRPKWVIGWAEDDGTAGAHCCTCWDLQLSAHRMFSNSDEAASYGCDGMMAIHWRTAAISPTIAALSRAGWDFNGATDPGSMDTFWADWGRGMFGGDAGAAAGQALGKLDGAHSAINALVSGGAGTTDARIDGFFAPLRRMETLRPRIQGVGNLERLDYWLNFVRASELRVRTWVLAARLTEEVKKVSAAAPEQKQALAQANLLPLRLRVVRSYEQLIAAFVACAKSPGEMGTISSIESGMREAIVSAHDPAIGQLLGQPLPPEAAVCPAYHGAPRIFVSARRTLVNAGDAQAIRAFVLSEVSCVSLDLRWRPLGKGNFMKTAAAHLARQAYRAVLPAQSHVTVEYYLEATLEHGQKILWPATAPAINQTVLAW